jgi:hypothetical protein
LQLITLNVHPTLLIGEFRKANEDQDVREKAREERIAALQQNLAEQSGVLENVRA